jgi:uncharacterized protein YjiK
MKQINSRDDDQRKAVKLDHFSSPSFVKNTQTTLLLSDEVFAAAEVQTAGQKLGL